MLRPHLNGNDFGQSAALRCTPFHYSYCWGRFFTVAADRCVGLMADRAVGRYGFVAGANGRSLLFAPKLKRARLLMALVLIPVL